MGSTPAGVTNQKKTEGMRKQTMRVENMPSITELMIRRLPSLYLLQETKVEDVKEGSLLIKSIENNINIISGKLPDKADELKELLNTQIAIIEHGYAGVGDNFSKKIEHETANK